MVEEAHSILQTKFLLLVSCTLCSVRKMDSRSIPFDALLMVGHVLLLILFLRNTMARSQQRGVIDVEDCRASQFLASMTSVLVGTMRG